MNFEILGSSQNDGFDKAISAREAEDFNQAFNVASGFVKAHHFDDTNSEAASLSNQLGADLRDAQTASHNYDVAMSRANRISDAKSFVESHSDQVNTDFNQAFPGYVESKVGEATRDELFSSPGDMHALNKLEGLADDFVSSKREQLIEQYGNQGHHGQLDSFYSQKSSEIAGQGNSLGASFQSNNDGLKDEAQSQHLGINHSQKDAYVQSHGTKFTNTESEVKVGEQRMDEHSSNKKLTRKEIEDQMNRGEHDAKTGVILDSGLLRALKNNNFDNKE